MFLSHACGIHYILDVLGMLLYGLESLAFVQVHIMCVCVRLLRHVSDDVCASAPCMHVCRRTYLCTYTKYAHVYYLFMLQVEHLRRLRGEINTAYCETEQGIELATRYVVQTFVE